MDFKADTQNVLNFSASLGLSIYSKSGSFLIQVFNFFIGCICYSSDLHMVVEQAGYLHSHMQTHMKDLILLYR